MPETIAIVGRPNVGKSTLFNRLTGRRAALVDPTPGLTRDRREADANLGPRTVRLVDTAGLEDARSGSIQSRMRAQTEAAIAGADAILFVVDARAGLMPEDEQFARLVRASGKPVVLVANKAEGKLAESGFYDAFKLGLGEPIPISAEHGEGIGDLIREMLAALPSAEAMESPESADGAETPARPLKVAIIGRPNAGKSTLVNALVGAERVITGPEPGLTRDAIEVPFKWRERTIALFDTAGLRKKARIVEKTEKLAAHDALNAVRFAEVVVLLLDVERPLEKQDLSLGDLVASEGRALVIAVNKWDLVEDKSRRAKEIREAVDDTLAQVKGVPVVFLSALGARGLDKLMDAVLEQEKVWNRRIGTSRLNRWLSAAIDSHSLPAVKGRRLKMRYMTQPHARPPTFVIFCSRPEAVPKSYLRFLVNDLRDTFELPGVPVRLQLRAGDNPYD